VSKAGAGNVLTADMILKKSGILTLDLTHISLQKPALLFFTGNPNPRTFWILRLFATGSDK
jgi:hypothetical protein